MVECYRMSIKGKNGLKSWIQIENSIITDIVPLTCTSDLNGANLDKYKGMKVDGGKMYVEFEFESQAKLWLNGKSDQ
jgi:hypothetical protein